MLSHFGVKETEATEVDNLPKGAQLVTVDVMFVSFGSDARAHVKWLTACGLGSPQWTWISVLRGMFDQLSIIPLTQFFSHFIVYMNYLGECLSVDCVQWGLEWGPKTLHPNRLPGDGAAAGTGPRFETVAQL